MVYGQLILEQQNQMLYNNLCQVISEATYILEDNDLVLEGANYEMYKAFKENKKDLKPHMKELKDAVINTDKNKAKTELDSCKKIINKMRKQIKDIPSDTSSAVISWFAHVILDIFRSELVILGFSTAAVGSVIHGAGFAIDNIIGNILSGIGWAGVTVGYIAAGIQIAISTIKSIIKLVNELRNKKGDIEVKDINMWKSKLLSFVDDYEKELTKIASSIK